MRIFGAILAGGQGRRMGGADKALLPLAGRPLIAHAIDRLEPQVERLSISANGDPARLARFGLPVLPDRDTSQGPLSGILAALDWAAPLGATHLVTAPTDAPFLPPDLTPRLLLAGDTALARSAGNDHPTFGLWPVALRDPLRAFLASGAKTSIRAFADAQGAARADFPDDGAFSNLNTPQDLATAEARIAAAT
ncbi:molybdenum cofactor guanylyltransferase MobA [Rhodobacteraceae bacterium HSP-20]|uniref:Molybdenum cofactor guanylyltransferase n=1 Tax=Paragemmobacter amnigenus TaxID=2852097 RepID=A0ABS6J874_9RHOB|nr:molybdenum cofactor guanylyltransferase MobA [Rhodobacter amnigenus]MBU9699074.1 molybdenum cofactor guanylyltransferase MobA [Rhodobacter amnigenus]MBV4390301.1 molybdenum cofactor guanylyltransferase MobA [Rhodobacter amnigenus]